MDSTEKREEKQPMPYEKIEYFPSGWGSAELQEIWKPTKGFIFCMDCSMRIDMESTVWCHVEAPGIYLCAVCKRRHQSVGSWPKVVGRRY